MESLLNRLNALRMIKSKSVRAFALDINQSQVSINNQLSGKRGINVEFVLSVLSAYPDVSAEWLLRGVGDMLISEQSGAITINMNNAEHGSVAGNNNTVTYDARTHELEEDCAHLREENKQLRDRCDKLTDKLLSL